LQVGVSNGSVMIGARNGRTGASHMTSKHLIYACMIHCMLLVVPSQAADGGVHWTYEGELGAEHWGELSPDYIQCKVGVNQSPIDIVNSIEADLSPLILEYNSNTIDLVNNGHTTQVNVQPGNYLRVEGEEFELLQFHIHAPSEHWINGEQFYLEVHYVHQNAQGQLAVIAVLYAEGKDHPKLEKYLSVVPTEIGKPVVFELPVNELPLFSDDKAYYRYNGSLTTPPCSEGVRWYILKGARTVSKERRDVFNQLIGDDARGPQPINGRPVLR
jgi:carbonic anhydrase